MEPMDYVTFTLIVDDIVYHEGRTAMEQLGGGGPQTAFGIRLWTSSARLGLAAGVGSDLPTSCKDWLAGFDVDTRGLLECPEPTLRAWQVLEEDGRRTQVWRSPRNDTIERMLRPPLSLLPQDYQCAKAYHVCVSPSGLDVPFIQELRVTGASVVSVEPYTHAEEGIPSFSELRALVLAGHIFSPNEKEAISLVGPGTPLEVVSRLAELGGEIVVLRRGPEGCIAHRATTGEAWEVPAFLTVAKSMPPAPPEDTSAGSEGGTEAGSASGSAPKLRDPTGCGNAFCGGFLAGWVTSSGDLLTAALRGSVSASFMAEHEGVPPVSRAYAMQAAARESFLRMLARRVKIP